MTPRLIHCLNLVTLCNGEYRCNCRCHNCMAVKDLSAEADRQARAAEHRDDTGCVPENLCDECKREKESFEEDTLRQDVAETIAAEETK